MDVSNAEELMELLADCEFVVEDSGEGFEFGKLVMLPDGRHRVVLVEEGAEEWVSRDV